MLEKPGNSGAGSGGGSDDRSDRVPHVWHRAARERPVLSRLWPPVEESGVRAEYKQVTVLFADVVHSMDIAATVGPERLREIMVNLAARCAAVVQR